MKVNQTPYVVLFIALTISGIGGGSAYPYPSSYSTRNILDSDTLKLRTYLKPTQIQIGLKSSRYEKESVELHPKDSIDLPKDAVWFSLEFKHLDDVGQTYKRLYKIAPLMDEYEEMPRSSQINLSGIAAGKYFISVQLQPLISGEKALERTWAVTKEPAFTESPLFYAMVCFGLGGICAYILYERSRRTKNEFQLRGKISRDLHDEVGGLLTGISMQADLLRLKMGDQEAQSIEAIGNHSRQSIQMMDDIIWAVDARNNDQESLGDRMKYVASQLFDPLDITVSFELEQGSRRKITQTVRQNLYLIFKEAIHNICKHSNATAVRIRLHFAAGNIELYISDNGTDTKKQYLSNRSGNGLRNMQLRADQIDAQLHVGYTENGYEVGIIAPNYEGRLLKWLKF